MADTFRVDGGIYTSPEVFEQEMDRIFGRTWVYLAHESELPGPGDYVTSYLGRLPVIVSRDQQGAVRVFFNRCRHRGAALVRHAAGNTRYFTCKYHGWSYAGDGRLAAVPMATDGAYPAEMDRSGLGLLGPPRVERYRGLVFACLDPQVEPLTDWLGDARPFIDWQFDRSITGEIDLCHGAHRSQYQGNWKFLAENSVDGYHANYVHDSFWQLLANFGNQGGVHGSYDETSRKDIIRRREGGWTQSFRNGHGMLAVPMGDDALRKLCEGPHADYLRRLEQARGPGSLARLMTNYYVVLFPNVALILDQIRTWRPVGADCTQVTMQPYSLVGAPLEWNRERLAGYQRFFGPSGFGSPDDVEIFGINQQGLAAQPVRWLELQRGLPRERAEGASRIGGATDETPQRGFHRQWQRMMGDAHVG